MQGKTAPKQSIKTIKLPSQSSMNSQHNFLSINQLSSINQQPQPNTISSLRKKHLLQYLFNKIKYLVAPRRTPKHIRQNWNEQNNKLEQDDEMGTQRQQIISQIKYSYVGWHFVMMIQIICAVFVFWASSIQLAFLPQFRNYNDNNLFNFQIKAIPCCFIILKIIMQQILIIRQRNIKRYNQQKQKSQSQSDKQIEQQNNNKNNNKNNKKQQDICFHFQQIFKNGVYLCSCVAYMIIHTIVVDMVKFFILFLIVIVLLNKIWNIKQNMEKVYSYVQSKDLKNQFRILILFFLVLGSCHLMGLILYSLTYLYPQKNWINSVYKPAVLDDTWFSHYTCSIYFTISTMATVGYGDFTPVQTGQMLLVCFIQLFGTALFGYMINVVGLSVVEINKKNQEFDNNISTINKLQSHYQISRQLCQKFKNDIIKNQSVKKQTPLSQKQQKLFFKMIQNSLKEQFILQTNIKVIKKSIFFLTHFTVNFQNEIALKLIRKIYKKNQKLPLVDYENEQGQRCMFLINTGSVDIDITNQSSNSQVRKFIKNISPQEGKPTLNVFGYSALIQNKDMDLQATTKDTSVIYLLRRKDVLQCMDKNMLDFEGIGELRQKMLQYKNINHVQAPTVMDLQKHYIPNIFFVHKKKTTKSQRRQQYVGRSHHKLRMKVITLKNYQFRTMVWIDLTEQSVKLDQSPLHPGSQQKNEQKQQNSMHMNSLKILQKIQNPQTIEVLDKFDQVKIFENFMKRYNINKIAPKYHQFLRKQRKTRKCIQHNQNSTIKQQLYELQESNQLLNNFTPNKRKLTYTQGMHRITERYEDEL